MSKLLPIPLEGYTLDRESQALIKSTPSPASSKLEMIELHQKVDRIEEKLDRLISLVAVRFSTI